MVTALSLEEVVAKLSRDVTNEAVQILVTFLTTRLELDHMRKQFGLA